KRCRRSLRPDAEGPNCRAQGDPRSGPRRRRAGRGRDRTAGATLQALKTFARQARKQMRTESGGYRRDHLRALAQRVEVGTKVVRIMGSKAYFCARSSPPRARKRRVLACQFCSDVARPKRFELLTFAFGGKSLAAPDSRIGFA